MSQIVSVLNVGLGGSMVNTRVAKMIANGILGTANIFSVTENMGKNHLTLVIALSKDVGPSLMYSLAEALRQDCIAYYSHEHDFGLLLGPDADLGDFDKRKFMRPDGSYLA